jgi:hypothetical protein
MDRAQPCRTPRWSAGSSLRAGGDDSAPREAPSASAPAAADWNAKSDAEKERVERGREVCESDVVEERVGCGRTERVRAAWWKNARVAAAMHAGARRSGSTRRMRP